MKSVQVITDSLRDLDVVGILFIYIQCMLNSVESVDRGNSRRAREPLIRLPVSWGLILFWDVFLSALCICIIKSTIGILIDILNIHFCTTSDNFEPSLAPSGYLKGCNVYVLYRGRLLSNLLEICSQGDDYLETKYLIKPANDRLSISSMKGIHLSNLISLIPDESFPIDFS
jgi:hypothetical protein